MKTSILPSLCLVFLASCDRDPTSPTLAPTTSGKTGRVSVSLSLGQVGVLARSAVMNPTHLVVAFTSSQSSTVRDTIALTGSGLVGKTYSLASQQGWTLQATGLDQRDSVLYSGSQTFTVLARKTTNVSLSLDARYSSLRVRFPVRDSLTRFVLTVDGQVWGDSSVAKQTRVGDTIKMDRDYLSASPSGIAHTFGLRVYGQPWGTDTLLYRLDTALFIVSGRSGATGLKLPWVGPKTPPPGQATLAVSLRSVSSLDIGIGYEDTTSPRGAFVDDRDGKIYKWTKIGSQVWMAENLDFAGSGRCRNGTVGVCDSLGRAYTFLEALAGQAPSLLVPSGVKGVCPTGWHLPSNGEWMSLLQVVGNESSRKLRRVGDAYNGNPGTDDFGFSWKQTTSLSAGMGVWGADYLLWTSSHDGLTYAYYLPRLGDGAYMDVALYHRYDLMNQYRDAWGVRCVRN